MSTGTLFAYGTLQDHDILLSVLGRTPHQAHMQVGYAPGFAAVFYPNRVYPALVSRETAGAHGLLLSELSIDDLTLLDAFEGDEYRRAELVVTLSGKPFRTQAYLPTTPIPHGAAEWSLAGWVQNHKADVLGAEQSLAAEIRARLSTR